MINLAIALGEICVKFIASLITAAVAAVEAVVNNLPSNNYWSPFSWGQTPG
jgi:hypothetical protein